MLTRPRTYVWLSVAGVFVAACGARTELHIAGLGGHGGLTATTSSSTSSASSTSGTPCMVPSPACGPDSYCYWPDQSCGGTDGFGVCTPRPGGCPKNLDPTCGCDGKVYGNPCEANRAGVDVDQLGGCKAPPGMFGCGVHFCALGGYYCKRVAMSNGSTFSCEPAPVACGGVASCDCLTGVAVECIGTCLSTMDGGILLACQKV